MVNERERADNSSILGNLLLTVVQLALVAVLVVGGGVIGRFVWEGILIGWNII